MLMQQESQVSRRLPGGGDGQEHVLSLPCRNARVAPITAREDTIPASQQAPGGLMPEPAIKLRDVARLAGVHPATASRALNPETRLLVSEETAKRVLAAAAELGYRPNAVARSLRTRRSHTVGVLIPDLNNPLFPPMIRGLEDRLAKAGYVALIGNTDGDDARERQVFEQMLARHVDGYVLATAHLRNPLLDEAVQAGLDVVLMNRVADGTGFPSVCADNELGARLAV